MRLYQICSLFLILSTVLFLYSMRVLSYTAGFALYEGKRLYTHSLVQSIYSCATINQSQLCISQKSADNNRTCLKSIDTSRQTFMTDNRFLSGDFCGSCFIGLFFHFRPLPTPMLYQIQLLTVTVHSITLWGTCVWEVQYPVTSFELAYLHCNVQHPNTHNSTNSKSCMIYPMV